MGYFVKQSKMSVMGLLKREIVSKVPLHIFYLVRINTPAFLIMA